MKTILILLLLVGSTVQNCFAFSAIDVENIINEYRIKQNLTKLPSEDQKAINSATKYAKKLSELGYLDHEDSQGYRSMDRYRKNEKGTAIRIGEILAAGTDLKKIMDAWLTSPTHKILIDDNIWTNMSAGVVKKNDVFIICVIFTNSIAKNIILDKNKAKLTFTLYISNLNKEIIVYANREEFYRTNSNKQEYSLDLPDTFKTGYITIINQNKQGDDILF